VRARGRAPGRAGPDAPPPPASEAPPLAKVRINPVVGPPPPAGDLLHRELTASLVRRRVAVAAGKDEAVDYYLRPYVLASIGQSGAKVSWVVDVTDPTGLRKKRFSGDETVPHPSQGLDPWAAVREPEAQALASKVADAFAAWRADKLQARLIAGLGGRSNAIRRLCIDR
jgi:hypothetical protein